MLITNSTAQNAAEMSQKSVQNSDVVLSARGISKKFCRDLKRSLVYGVKDIASELSGLRGDNNDRLRKKEFLALNNVNLELRRGEALGLVGKNGSGKSTLLRIIAGLIKPDRGEVTVNGRVAPLIALGAGFNPVLTGRENVYANMSILGLSREEIRKRFDEVIGFSGIGDAIDSPVQNYSSGMQARLGFSSAIHTDPDILLIDEVLAVGDAKFRAKCHRKLSQLRREGTSFILVSHDSLSILAVCDTAIYLSGGKLILEGDSNSVVGKYEEDLFLGKGSHELSEMDGELTFPDRENKASGLQIKTISFKDESYNTLRHLLSGEPASLTVEGIAFENLRNVNLSVIVSCLSESGDEILALKSSFDGKSFEISRGKFTLQLKMPYCGLKIGIYSAKINLSSSGASVRSFDILDFIESFKFAVKNEEGVNKSSYYQPREWMLIDEEK